MCGETLRCQLKIDQGSGSAERKSDADALRKSKCVCRIPWWSPGQTLPPTIKANSSQVRNFDDIVWPPTGLGLAQVGSSWLKFDQSSNFRPTLTKFPPFDHLCQLKPTLAKLLCYCYVSTRSYLDNWMVFLQAGSTWRYRLANRRCKFDFVTWFELAWVGSAVGPGLNSRLITSGLPASVWWIDRLGSRIYIFSIFLLVKCGGWGGATLFRRS